MGSTLALTSTVGSVLLAAAGAQGPELRGMHDRLDWGMWLRQSRGRRHLRPARHPGQALCPRRANRQEYLPRRDDTSGR